MLLEICSFCVWGFAFEVEAEEGDAAWTEGEDSESFAEGMDAFGGFVFYVVKNGVAFCGEGFDVSLGEFVLELL